MRIIFVSLLCLVLIGMTSYSYAQYMPVDSNTKVPEITLQLQLRDSGGNLITYIETNQVTAIDPSKLNEFLDRMPLQYKEEFSGEDDKTYVINQWQGQTLNYDKREIYSQFNFWVVDQNMHQIVLTVRHHSVQTQPGDTLTVYWTIIRLAN